MHQKNQGTTNEKVRTCAPKKLYGEFSDRGGKTGSGGGDKRGSNRRPVSIVGSHVGGVSEGACTSRKTVCSNWGGG